MSEARLQTNIRSSLWFGFGARATGSHRGDCGMEILVDHRTAEILYVPQYWDCI